MAVFHLDKLLKCRHCIIIGIYILVAHIYELIPIISALPFSTVLNLIYATLSHVNRNSFIIIIIIIIIIK